MAKVILIMGLPGSGKTFLANEVKKLLPDVMHLNGDVVRQKFNDWDFSPEGRIRQANRMRTLASESTNEYVVIDFICPLPQMRDIISPDMIVWVDTIDHGRFEDTNRMFVPPEKYDMRVTEQNAETYSKKIIDHLGITKPHNLERV